MRFSVRETLGHVERSDSLYIEGKVPVTVLTGEAAQKDATGKASCHVGHPFPEGTFAPAVAQGAIPVSHNIPSPQWGLTSCLPSDLEMSPSRALTPSLCSVHNSDRFRENETLARVSVGKGGLTCHLGSYSQARPGFLEQIWADCAQVLARSPWAGVGSGCPSQRSF